MAAELDGGGQPVSLVEGDVEERAGGKKKEPESGRDLATGVEAGQSLAGTLPFAREVLAGVVGEAPAAAVAAAS